MLKMNYSSLKMINPRLTKNVIGYTAIKKMAINLQFFRFHHHLIISEVNTRACISFIKLSDY